MRRATIRPSPAFMQPSEISIHALHEESDATLAALRPLLTISIHALHEESDRCRGDGVEHVAISIHALHEESDPFANAVLFWTGISIHALHEESDSPSPSAPRSQDAISIHALHEESDRCSRTLYRHRSTFQSTLSMRRATASSSESYTRHVYFNPRSP